MLKGKHKLEIVKVSRMPAKQLFPVVLLGADFVGNEEHQVEDSLAA
jgi:hypothetical protein